MMRTKKYRQVAVVRLLLSRVAKLDRDLSRHLQHMSCFRVYKEIFRPRQWYQYWRSRPLPNAAIVHYSDA